MVGKIQKALGFIFFFIGIFFFISTKDILAQFQLFPAFGRIIVSGQTTIIANGFPSSLTIVAGSGVTLTTNNITKTLTISSSGGGGSGITSINTDITAAQTLTIGTTGTDFVIVDNGTGDHKFNIPSSSAANRGLLSSTDWSNFNTAFGWGNHAGLYVPIANKWQWDGGATNLVAATGRTSLGLGSIALLSAIDISSNTNLAVTAPIVLTNDTVSITQSTTTTDGYLSSTDWNTFNNKVSNATHTGDATGSVALRVVGINNVIMSALGTGILKNTTGTGVPSIAIAGDFPTLNQNTSGNAATVTTNANLTGPVTSVGNATTITDAAVTLAKMANMATASVIYRKTAGTGVPEVNTISTLKTDMSLNLVENTALSTWPGSTNITTLGTIATGSIPESKLTFTDITTGNSATTQHGFLKKLDNTTTNFMNGQGNWAAPAGTVYTGTANQVIVTGTVLSTPQNIATGSTPQFAGLGLGTVAAAGQFITSSGSSAGNLISLKSTNTNAGATAYSSLQLGNDLGTRFAFFLMSSANTAYTGVDSITFDMISNSPMGFATNDTVRMRILGDGKLGINTPTPQAPVSISRAGNEGFEFTPGNTSGVNLLINFDRIGSAYNTLRIDSAAYEWRIGSTVKWGINAAGDFTGLTNNIVLSQGVPTISSGGGTSPTIRGNDYGFEITLGTFPSVGGIVVNFGHTFTNKPIPLTGTSDLSATVQITAISTTSVTITVSGSPVAGDKIWVANLGV